MKVSAVTIASLAVFVSGCTPTPEGITGPCPPPPVIAPPTSEVTDTDWFTETAEIVNDYATQLVGFTETAAEQCVLEAGLGWRVVARDGEFFAVTTDYSPQRINVVVGQSGITEASAG